MRVRTNRRIVMALLGYALVFVLLPGRLGKQQALAVDDFVEPEVRYEQALSQLQRSGLLARPERSGAIFPTLDWVGKTALINLVCPVGNDLKNTSACRTLLLQGIKDNALVVRDHSLRTLLARSSLSSELKIKAASQIVEDERNYRRGKPLWIVTSAKSYLALQSKNSN